MPNDRPAKKAAAPKKSTAHKGRTTEAKPIDSKNPKNLTVTSAAEWGKAEAPKEEGFITELPSGNVVRMIRTMDLPIMLATGQIPNPLAGIVTEMMEQQTNQFPAEQAGNMKVMKQLMNLLNTVFCNAVLEPKFSMPEIQKEDETQDAYYERINQWEVPEGTVSVFNVVLQDKMYVYAVAQGAAADLARFRSESESGVLTVPAGTDLGDNA